VISKRWCKVAASLIFVACVVNTPTFSPAIQAQEKQSKDTQTAKKAAGGERGRRSGKFRCIAESGSEPSG
jgi:hypothetical protein